MRETTAERKERKEACASAGLHANRVWLTCCIHGARGHVVDVVFGNIGYFDEHEGAWRCDPSHPGCFDWFDRASRAPGAASRDTTTGDA